MGATGNAILNFGNAPGTNTATVAVTGQTGISSVSSYAEAWVSCLSTTDHNFSNLKIIQQKTGFFVDTVIDNVGFTITATTELRLTGSIKVNWVWN